MDILQKKYELGRLEVAFIIIILLTLVGAGLYAWRLGRDKEHSINSFAECVAAGNPVMESYPEQCAANGRTFTNPDQSPVQPPESEGTSTGLDLETDKAAILSSLTAYCQANGAAVTNELTDQLKANMEDSALFVQSGRFARLAATCGEGGFRAFLSRNDGEPVTWKFIGGGQEETLACTALDSTGVPADIATTCFDESGQLRPIAPAV